ncbi:thiamine-phosphate kinase [Ottowia caeni]|uniref:thiamine-phosphate kinase n=1 Tax=Ottowia caeni TaxID=2870339 RepID=UPI001E460664|nr:thiamine-phosphate kinase [Ottowia caeni]
MGEFELIERFFKVPAQSHAHSGAVELGIGDDCALLKPAPGMQLAVSTDMLVEGRHFLPDVDPTALGHKALAVNLSDLAAMGAEPMGFTLALALPAERANDANWLQAFSGGLFSLADAFSCPLIGGDTTGGPLNICITVFGQLPAGQALRRDGARVGDDIWVSGELGSARLGLGTLRGEWTLPPAIQAAARLRLERPTPRLALGKALRGLASACADVSDGLAGDLGHILRASGAGACLDAESILNTIPLRALMAKTSEPFDTEKWLGIALTGGDDYELVFTAPPASRAAVQTAAELTLTTVARVGRIESESGLRLTGGNGQPHSFAARAFDHFATAADSPTGKS